MGRRKAAGVVLSTLATSDEDPVADAGAGGQAMIGASLAALAGRSAAPVVDEGPGTAVVLYGRVQVLEGDDRLSVARRAFGLADDAPRIAVSRACRALERANEGREWTVGALLWLPGHEVEGGASDDEALP